MLDLNPVFSLQAQDFESISRICLQHLSHLPIFLFIVLAAAFVLMPLLSFASVYLINRLSASRFTNKGMGFGCANCGESVEVDWEFCPKCGAEVYLPTHPIIPNEVAIIEGKPELSAPMPSFFQLTKTKKEALVSDTKKTSSD